MSLKTNLTILFVAFTLIALVAFGAIVFSQAGKTLEAIRLAQLNNIADLKKDKIETFFHERRIDIESLRNIMGMKSSQRALISAVNNGSGRAYRQAKEELDNRIKPLLKAYGYLDIMFTDRQGNIVYVCNPGDITVDFGRMVRDRKAFEEGKKNIYFTDVFLNDKLDNAFEMLGVAPLRDANGNFVGEVVIEIDMGPIFNFIQDNTVLGKTGETLIDRREGNKVLFLSPLRHVPDAALKKSVAFENKMAFAAQKSAAGENGSGIAFDYRGTEVLAAWRYIPFLRWGLVTKIDAVEAFAPVRELKIIVISVGALIVLIGVFVALAISGTVTRPILSLQKGAEAIAAGDLGHRVGTGANDEIGQLARSFDAMTDALVRDIVRREKAEESIKALNEDLLHYIRQLEETNKELETFSYSVSHDLRSPLRSIDGFSLALLEDYADKLDAEGKDYLERVRSATQRMAQLIDDLLKLSRVARLEMTRDRVSLSDIAKNIAGRLTKNHPERSVEFSIADGLIAYGDERLLTVALENLFSNAWKFSNKKPQTVIKFGAIQKDGAPAYFVKDNGAGFDMTYVNKLFNPFQRLHREAEYSGTGIGLATVKRIINRHGGQVRIESEIEKGTTVYFTL